MFSAPLYPKINLSNFKVISRSCGLLEKKFFRPRTSWLTCNFGSEYTHIFNITSILSHRKILSYCTFEVQHHYLTYKVISVWLWYNGLIDVLDCRWVCLRTVCAHTYVCVCVCTYVSVCIFVCGGV